MSTGPETLCNASTNQQTDLYKSGIVAHPHYGMCRFLGIVVIASIICYGSTKFSSNTWQTLPAWRHAGTGPVTTGAGLLPGPGQHREPASGLSLSLWQDTEIYQLLSDKLGESQKYDCCSCKLWIVITCQGHTETGNPSQSTFITWRSLIGFLE